MNASREARFAAYAALLRKWNPSINLVAPNSLAQLEDRHLADSAQLAQLAPDDDEPWLDIGSGGGLPGLVLAIEQPDRPIRLVDSDGRKVAFLRTVIQSLGLSNCTALQARIEELPPASVRHISARALAPLPRLVPYLDRHLAEGGTGWLLKGRNWQAEFEQLGSLDHYRLTVHPSRTDPQAAILQLDRKTIG
ncbi:16S rRNA (guanine(527)-N(7))-methyltransferase RsmG [Paracoccus contaminans]|uniref:Ribosomal RNA small subunit methyltransferase G n=1 Tax=Paracoccus contaminans TaxID=1945662 RepID=A0A1W6CWG1_9RHOB|nr:16S rRNA (guanine(527)-N(7))-methyltransferase RsmG [Paracoccus contaminans]ARJ69194.1 16S rRNA (guanine(527)-N(7))-methyltransferase RsmG [Paracoccus contaminans]